MDGQVGQVYQYCEQASAILIFIAALATLFMPEHILQREYNNNNDNDKAEMYALGGSGEQDKRRRCEMASVSRQWLKDVAVE